VLVAISGVEPHARQSMPHGGLQPFHQKSTCLTQLTLGPKFGHVTLQICEQARELGGLPAAAVRELSLYLSLSLTHTHTHTHTQTLYTLQLRELGRLPAPAVPGGLRRHGERGPDQRLPRRPYRGPSLNATDPRASRSNLAHKRPPPTLLELSPKWPVGLLAYRRALGPA